MGGGVIEARKESQAAAAGQPPLVAHIFPTFAGGGAHVRFAAIANHFGPAFRHIVVALDGRLDCRERLHPGLDVTFPAVEATKNEMLANAWRFRRQLRTWAPDVLVTCNWGAIEFALANMLPVTRHLHVVDGFGPEERDNQLQRRIWVRRIALSRSPVILPSRNLMRIASQVWKLPRRMIRYVPNGVDLSRFANDGTRRGGIEPVIGTVAALRPEKNLPRLLRAFARLPTGRLVIVGDGPEQPALNDLAAALGVRHRVVFAGHHTETAAFYATFDIFALSSDTEQMPLSVIEAMASGLPVVSTDVGDVRQMVAAPNAQFVTHLDDTALVGSLTALMNDPGLRAELGAANLAKARADFDQTAMFATYGALWRGAESIP